MPHSSSRPRYRLPCPDIHPEPLTEEAWEAFRQAMAGALEQQVAVGRPWAGYGGVGATDASFGVGAGPGVRGGAR